MPSEKKLVADLRAASWNAVEGRLILGVDHALASQVPAKVGHRNALVEIVRIAYLAGLDDGYAMGYEDGALSVAPNALVPGAPTAEAEG